MLRPFSIYDLRSGLKLDRKPWILPAQAWTQMQNAYPLRGRILRRPGTTLFGELSSAGALHTLTGSGGQLTVTSTLHGGAIGPVARFPEVDFAGSAGAHIYVATDGIARQRLGYGAADAELNPTSAQTIVVNAGETIVPGTFVARDLGSSMRVTFDVNGNPQGDYDAARSALIDPVSGTVNFTFSAALTGLIEVTYDVYRSVTAGPGHPFVTTQDGGYFEWKCALPGRVLPRDDDPSLYAAIAVGPGGVVEYESALGLGFGNTQPPFGIGSFCDRENVWVKFNSGAAYGLTYFGVVYQETITVPSGDPRIVAGGNKTWEFKGPGPIIPGEFTAYNTGATDSITFDSDGVVSGDHDPAGPNTINFETGQAIVTFLVDPGVNPGVEIWSSVGTFDFDTGEFEWELYETSAADWFMFPRTRPLTVSGGVDDQNAVMGIVNFFPEAGGEYLFALDRRRLWSWNGTYFAEAIDTDFWEAEPNDFYWFVPSRLRADEAKNVLLICNRKNILTYFDGTDLKEVHTDWRTAPVGATEEPPDPLTGTTGDGVAGVGLSVYERQIDTAEIAIMHPRNRIVLLGTTESGTFYPRRARWSEVNAYVDYTPGGAAGDQQWFASEYDDAQTEDAIVSAGMLGDDLYVWFRGKASGGGSLWRLVWQDDYRRPFYWEFVSDFDGSYAPKSTVTIQGTQLATLSPTQFVTTDGRSVVPLDAEIPDYISGATPAAFDMSFAGRANQHRAVLVTMAFGSADYPNNIMCYQYEDKAWSRWKFEAHCLAPYRFTGTPETWDQVEGTWEQDRTFDETRQRPGYPTMLIGDREMRIHQLGDGHDDEYGGSIPLTIATGELNPFREQQQMCRLAKIDFIFSPCPGETMRVLLTGGFETIPYAVHEIDLSPVGVASKQLKRTILVNESKSGHTISIQQTGTGPFALDAITLWAEEAGEIREVG